MLCDCAQGHTGSDSKKTRSQDSRLRVVAFAPKGLWAAGQERRGVDRVKESYRRGQKDTAGEKLDVGKWSLTGLSGPF